MPKQAAGAEKAHPAPRELSTVPNQDPRPPDPLVSLDRGPGCLNLQTHQAASCQSLLPMVWTGVGERARQGPRSLAWKGLAGPVPPRRCWSGRLSRCLPRPPSTGLCSAPSRAGLVSKPLHLSTCWTCCHLLPHRLLVLLQFHRTVATHTGDHRRPHHPGTVCGPWLQHPPWGHICSTWDFLGCGRPSRAHAGASATLHCPVPPDSTL